MKLTFEQARAIVALLQLDDFRVFVEAAADEAEKLNESLIMNPGLETGKMFSLQGETRAMVNLIKTIESAPSVLKDLSTQKERKV